MCGRKTLTMSKKAIIEELMVDEWQVEDYAPSYNIAPTQNSLVLVQEKASKIVRSMKWGLIPAWSKSELYGSKMINARAETVTTKPSFKIVILDNDRNIIERNVNIKIFIFLSSDLKGFSIIFNETNDNNILIARIINFSEKMSLSTLIYLYNVIIGQ